MHFTSVDFAGAAVTDERHHLLRFASKSTSVSACTELNVFVMSRS